MLQGLLQTAIDKAPDLDCPSGKSHRQSRSVGTEGCCVGLLRELLRELVLLSHREVPHFEVAQANDKQQPPAIRSDGEGTKELLLLSPPLPSFRGERDREAVQLETALGIEAFRDSGLIASRADKH